MLIEFFGKNFGCFRDEFRLSMLAADIDKDSPRGIVEVNVEGDPEPLRLLRCAAIYGPNASGKSTIIRAAAALRYLIAASKRMSSDEPIRVYEPFALGPKRDEPVELGVVAVIEGRVYRYVVAFDQLRITRESLQQIPADSQPITLFDRELQNTTGEWRSDQQFQLVTSDFRTNALVLSLADSFTPKLAKNIATGLRRLLLTNEVPNIHLWHPFGVSSVAKRATTEEPFAAWLRNALRAADFGVVDFETQTERWSADPSSGDSAEQESVSDERVLHSFVFLHAAKEGHLPLPFFSESLGTRRFVTLAPLFFDLMHEQRPAARWVDELDSSLHPTLLDHLVSQFNCDLPNDRVRGQLIFNTHESSLMEAEAREAVLRRDQIYLTEKALDGSARLYSVVEFKVRSNNNVRKRYLEGRFGALPTPSSLVD